MNKPRAIISYARMDGEEFAKELRERIEKEEPEITLWQDRTNMVGGVGWRNQIAKAIEQVEFLILVMTPGALKSETTRWEWQYARQQGVCVFPVQVPDKPVDFGAMPRWMSESHFYDLEQEWQTFVTYLKSSCHQLRIPHMPPGLPANCVRRDKTFESVLNRLLSDDGQGITGTTVALYGAGGFGKTTLASAVCQDDRIIYGFEDGILWTTVGQNPDLRSKISKLYAGLTGDSPGFLDDEEASRCLAEKLADRHCLIVLDDVWDSKDLHPFLEGGSGSTRLITTRHFPLAAAQSVQIQVDVMRQDESVSMLARFLPAPPSDIDPLTKLARRLGHWPLLLELAGAQLRTEVARPGGSIENGLAYVNKALDRHGIIALDSQDADERNQAVSASMEASLNYLSQDERNMYVALSLLPEDFSIPLRMAGVIWGSDDFLTEQTARRLMDFSLIRFNVKSATIRLHDVIRKYLASHLRRDQDFEVLAERLVKVLLTDPSESFRVAMHKSLTEHFGQFNKWPDDLQDAFQQSQETQVKIFLAEILDMEGQHEEALKVCEQLLSCMSDERSMTSSVRVLIARYLEHQGKYIDSLRILTDLVATFADEQQFGDTYWWAQYHIGIAQYRLRRFASSRQTLELVRDRAIRDDHALSARHQLGVVYLELGDNNEAFSLFEYCQQNRREDEGFRLAYAPRRIGQIRALEGKMPEASIEFEQSASISLKHENRRHWKLAKRDQCIFVDIPEYVIQEQSEQIDLHDLARTFSAATDAFDVTVFDLTSSFRVIYRHEGRIKNYNGYLEVFDEERRESKGIAARWKTVHSKGIFHGTVAVLLVDSDGKLLVQCRKESESNGKWDVSVGGHMEVGDSPELSAILEAYEEIGLIIDEDKLVPVGERLGFRKVGGPNVACDIYRSPEDYEYKTGKKNCELMSVFVARIERNELGDPIVHRSDRIPALKWATVKDAYQEATTNRDAYASTFKHLFGSEQNCELINGAIDRLLH